MIPIHTPALRLEARLESERRRRLAAERAAVFTLYVLASILVGVMSGQVIAYLTP